MSGTFAKLATGGVTLKGAGNALADSDLFAPYFTRYPTARKRPVQIAKLTASDAV